MSWGFFNDYVDYEQILLLKVVSVSDFFVVVVVFFPSYFLNLARFGKSISWTEPRLKRPVAIKI